MSKLFTPNQAGTVTISVTSTSGNTALPTSGGGSLLLTNLGTNKCFIKITSDSAATASATADMPILAGRALLISCGDATRIAHICAATETATLYVTRGVGGI